MSLTEEAVLQRFDNPERLKKLSHFLVNYLAARDHKQALVSFAAANIDAELALELLAERFAENNNRDVRVFSDSQYIREATEEASNKRPQG